MQRGPIATVASFGKSGRLRKLWNARLLIESAAAALEASIRIGVGVPRAESRTALEFEFEGCGT
jgi:hypothetical protein